MSAAQDFDPLFFIINPSVFDPPLGQVYNLEINRDRSAIVLKKSLSQLGES